jgi:hypothetical protein
MKRLIKGSRWVRPAAAYQARELGVRGVSAGGVFPIFWQIYVLSIWLPVNCLESGFDFDIIAIFRPCAIMSVNQSI